MAKRIFIFILFLSTINCSYAQSPLIKHYTIADGLPTNTVYSVYQDNEKFLWFSTDAGAIRFNGRKFEVFDKSNGLTDNEVIRIKQDKSGRIWFFNLNLSLNYYFEGKIYNSTNSDILKQIKSNFLIHDFYEAEDSSLYFYNLYYNIFEVKPDNEVVKYKLNIEHANDGTLLQMDKSDSGDFLLWTKLNLFGLSSMEDRNPRLIKNLSRNRGIFTASQNKNVYIGVNKKLEIYKDTMQIEKFNLDLGTNIVNSILIDKNGYIWVSTLDKGVFCVKEKQIIFHLDIEQAQAIIQDKENNIWITSMKNGIYKLSPYFNQVKHYNNSNFNNKPILKLEKNNQGGVLGINTNSLFLINYDRVYTTSKNFDYKSLKDILQLNNDDIITIEFDENIYRSSITQINKSNNSFSLEKRLVYEGNYGKKIVIDYVNKKVMSYNSNKIRSFYPNGKLIESTQYKVKSRIYNIFYNHRNELVINTRKNYLFLNDSLIDYTLLNEINGQIITSQIILNDSSEVLNINGSKLLLLYGDKTFDLSHKSELHYKFKFKHLAYTKPYLFISTIKEIYYITNPESIINGGNIDLKDVDIEFNNINDIKCNNDTLFVASDDGITIIPLDENLEYSIPTTRPYFSSISVNQQNIDFSTARISYKGDKRLNIQFSDINYSSYPTHYSYIMKGLDDKWVESFDGNAIYQNLAPGTYTFCVKSKINSNNYSQIKELVIIIRPTLYQHISFWIFIGLVGSLLILVTFYFLKNRTNKKREIEHQLLSLEHKALRSMMNPHFIFNSLGSIQSYLLQNKSSEAGLYLSQFARLIRQNMNSLKSNFISIEDEADRLRNYMELERLRMNNKFDYSIDFAADIEADEILIPSMMIQVFVENAIWHGISPLESKGVIKIQFIQSSKKSIDVIIEDNGVGIIKAKAYNKSETHLNLGMDLTKKRLQILGKKFNIDARYYSSELYPGKPNPGTKIILRVPILYE